MVSDDERRRVAAALRAVDAEKLDRDYGVGDGSTHAVLTLCFVAQAAGLHLAPYDFNAVELRDRLANLIEPGDSKGIESDAFNREALLALADEMDRWALMCDHYDRQVSPSAVSKYASRIRELCGVTR